MAHIATYLCTDGVANHPLWFYSVLDQVLLRTRLLIFRSCLNKHPTIVWTREVFGSPGPLARLVGNKGLEPLRLSALEPKSSASANSANSPNRASGQLDHPSFYKLFCYLGYGLYLRETT